VSPNTHMRWTSVCLLFVLALSAMGVASAQSDPQRLGVTLKEEILSPTVALFQLRQYILSEVAKPPSPANSQDWTAEANRLRQHLLNDIVFHGWPREWVTSPPKFEDLGPIEHSGAGYRMRKLRYEIVPGFDSTAILYEPENLQSKVPAILNVNGHVGPEGKAVEYKQKRCINFAKQGMIALNLEWLGMGELSQTGNQHWFGAHLDLVGANEVGLFYLAMRRGLDYLYDDPRVDQNRLGVTGLSGGGWQTIVLSSLDDRVAVAVPVAGFSSINPRVEARWYGDLGDVEQSASDLFQGRDYTHLLAIRAPKPTLLIYNAEDDCCFRAPLVKPLVFDAMRPLFKLYDKENNLQWHENRDPSTHNYQLDNRLQAYRFFSENFKMPVVEKEIPSDAEIKSYSELEVGIPKDNLTILSLAQKFGREISRAAIPSDSTARESWASSEREKLKELVRFKPVEISRVWAVANTKNKGIETKSYLFSMNNGLSADAVWVKAITSPETAPATIVLNDKGKSATGEAVSDRVNRGEQVLALDLIFSGDAWKGTSPYAYEQILHGLGDRPLGLEVAQLLELAHWLQHHTLVPKVRLESAGIRNQVAAEIAAALEPNLFSDVVIHEGMPSLSFLLEAPIPFADAPELFCLDLYKDFDLDRFIAMAAPTWVTTKKLLELPKKTDAAASGGSQLYVRRGWQLRTDTRRHR
jgi:dienelactone hydrolase